MRRGPLAGRYGPTAVMVIFALVPYLALSAAVTSLTGIIGSNLHMSANSMSLAFGLGNAGYAAGTVLAVAFAQHLPQRRMLLVYATLLVIGSFMTAAAQDAPMFFVGHILQGVCTSLMLIAAVPALAVSYGTEKLRETAMIMNMCIFGAVAIGPAIGGLQAHAHAWRPLFFIVAVISLGAWVLVLLTFEDAPAADTSAPWDPRAIALAIGGPSAAFFGASELTAHKFLSAVTIVPLAIGLLLILLLVVYQYRAKRPLLTIRSMLQSSMPVAGLVVALFAAAASVSATELTAGVLLQKYPPLHVGLLYLPELAGAILTAFALGAVINKRAMHYLPLAGMVFLAAGIAVFRIKVPSSEGLTLVASGLTGIGLGATVAPALFVAGFSLPSANLQRVFALVELLRACAAFMIAPIFAHMAETVGGSLKAGTGIALWIGLGLAVSGAVVAVAIYAFSGARPETPDLEGFVNGDTAAWHSPPLLAGLRSRSSGSGVLAEEPA
jgi:hypothetical protein